MRSDLNSSLQCYNNIGFELLYTNNAMKIQNENVLKKIFLPQCELEPAFYRSIDGRSPDWAIGAMNEFDKKLRSINVAWILTIFPSFPIPHSAWREFYSTYCGLSPYPKGPPGPEKLSIFNFGYVKEVCISGLLGVKGFIFVISSGSHYQFV